MKTDDAQRPDAGAGAADSNPGGALPPESEKPEDLREMVRVVAAEQDLSQSQIANQIGCSGSVLSQWLNGKYPGDVAGLEARVAKWVARYRSVVEAQRALGAAGEFRFIETISARAYLKALEYAHSLGSMVLIYGASGDGKSTAARQFAATRTNVFVCECRPSGTALYFAIKRVAQTLGVHSEGFGTSDLSDRITKKLRDSQGLLIVDEADHLSPAAIEELRRIHDESGAGIALIGNYSVYSRMVKDKQMESLARVYSRLGRRVQSTTLPGDVEAIARGLGIVARDQLAYLKGLAQEPGHLRNVVQVVRQARIRAASRSEEQGVEHLQKAWTESVPKIAEG